MLGAVIAAQHGDVGRQRALLMRGLERNPYNWYPYLELGLIEARRGNTAAGLRLLRRAHALNPIEETIEFALERVGDGDPPTQAEIDEEIVRSSDFLTGVRAAMTGTRGSRETSLMGREPGQTDGRHQPGSGLLFGAGTSMLDATWRLGMKKLVLMGFVIAALAVVPAAVADSTLLGGYGSSAAKPVVQVKGATGGKSSTASSTSSNGPSTLPFTGSDLAVFMVAGVLLVGIGVGLRRLGRDKA